MDSIESIALAETHATASDSGTNVGNPTDIIKVLPGNTPFADKPGCVNGNGCISLAGHRDEPPRKDSDTLSGTGHGAVSSLSLQSEQPPMKVAEISAQFQGLMLARKFKPRTIAYYGQVFRRFAEHSELEHLTKAQFAKVARNLIRDYIQSVPERSMRFEIAALKTVLDYGLDMRWPCSKSDFPRLPAIGRVRPPSDAEIKPFYDAVQVEPNVEMKSLILMELTYGLRPENQLAALKWKHIIERNERLYGFYAVGAENDFKTDSPFIGYIPPLLADALMAWKADAANTNPEDYIWPWRNRNSGKLGRHTDESLLRALEQFKNRYGIRNKVSWKSMRHWVVHIAENRMQLPKAYASYWRGHKPQGGMEAQYAGNLPLEEILERQEAMWPDGPLGIFCPKVSLSMEGFDEDETALMRRLKSGTLSPENFAFEWKVLERVRSKAVKDITA